MSQEVPVPLLARSQCSFRGADLRYVQRHTYRSHDRAVVCSQGLHQTVEALATPIQLEGQRFPFDRLAMRLDGRKLLVLGSEVLEDREPYRLIRLQPDASQGRSLAGSEHQADVGGPHDGRQLLEHDPQPGRVVLQRLLDVQEPLGLSALPTKLHDRPTSRARGNSKRQKYES